LKNSKKPKAISLFCGAGGCSLGFEKAGYSIAYASDNNSQAISTYKDNFSTTKANCEDIQDIDFKILLKHLNLEVGALDILIGGPPCQGFTTAGHRFWDDPRNHLLKKYVHALEVLRPKWFFMENVEGLLTSNQGKYVHEATSAFVNLGYKIRLEKIYSHEYGVPQRRKRVIIIGNRLGIDFEMPKPTFQASGHIYRNGSVTINETIKGLPKAGESNDYIAKYTSNASSNFEAYLRNDATVVTDHYYSKLSGASLQRIEALKPGQTMKDLPERLQHDSFKRRANRRVADGTPSEKRGGSPSGLKRLIGQEPCLTITSAATREFIHPTENRPLTIRECARIQTFPDSFSFNGTAQQKALQIGNAIPPVLACVFAEHIKNNYGFSSININDDMKGGLLGYKLTKSDGMSPALNRTDTLLGKMINRKSAEQLELI